MFQFWKHDTTKVPPSLARGTNSVRSGSSGGSVGAGRSYTVRWAKAVRCFVVVTARSRGSVFFRGRRVVVTALQIRGALSWLPWHIAKSTDLVRSRC